MRGVSKSRPFYFKQRKLHDRKHDFKLRGIKRYFITRSLLKL